MITVVVVVAGDRYQRRGAVVVCGVDVSAGGHKQLHGGVVTAKGGQVERCSALLCVPRVQIRPCAHVVSLQLSDGNDQVITIAKI